MENSENTRDEWQRIAGSSQVLLRSRIEIGKLLNQVREREGPLCASSIPGKALFISRLRYVDPDHEYLLADYCDNRVANGALLSAEKVTFNCGHSLGSIEFLATHFVEATFESDLVVRMDFPEVLILQQRRLHQRIRVIPELPLRCKVDVRGATVFELKITDISRGGLGTVAYDSAVKLKPGLILKDCKIIHPSGRAIRLDIEVRHCSKIVLADGTEARHAGCRFLGDPSEVEELVKVFILNMEKPGS